MLFFKVGDRTITNFIIAWKIVLLVTLTKLLTFYFTVYACAGKTFLPSGNPLVIFFYFPRQYILVINFLCLFALLSLILMMPWVLFSVSFGLFVTIHFLQQILEPKLVDEAEK